MNHRGPIACTLSPREYADRTPWITALNRTALRSVEREGRRIALTYVRSARSEVLELVRREAACCAFLTFEVEESTDVIHLRIEAPDVDGPDVLLAPFLAGAEV